MARVEKYRRLPNGFPTLLNKMLRAVLVSRPLEAARFFADYLEAEVNRKTLCDLQLRQPCPSGIVQATDPWVHYMSFVTIQEAIDDLLREEQPTPAFQWDDHPRQFTAETRKCRLSSGRRRSHRSPWPPIVKPMLRCRRRFDRYGPIVKKITISGRAIRRYVTEEGAPGATDQCQGRRPIANYWRLILRDCSVMANEWNRKREEPSRRRRSSSSLPAVEMTSSEVDEEEGEGEDPYMEPKRRRKARNDEGLAKIILRELGGGAVGGGQPPSEVGDEGLMPGRASKAVQVELVHSALPRHFPPPPPTQSMVIEARFPVETFDKAIQVNLDDDDWASSCPTPDLTAPELDIPLSCPPEPLPLTIDWTDFLRPLDRLSSDSDINWMSVDEDTDGRDAPSIQVEPSPTAEDLPTEVVQLVDLDIPATTAVADAPAMELLLAERDVPAGSTKADVPAEPIDSEDYDALASSDLADVPAEPLDPENDAPASSALADVPAEPMVPAMESAARLMDGDEVDDPFAD